MDSLLKRALSQIFLEECFDDEELRIRRMETLFTARCCACPHVIEVTKFMLDSRKLPAEVNNMILVCGGCLRYLWVEAPGFREVSRKDFKALPRELREYLERTRALVEQQKRMGPTLQ